MTQNELSWRWPLWVTMIYSGVCLALFYVVVPETLAPVLLQRKARGLRKSDPVGNKDVYAEHERGDWSLKGVIRRTVSRPVEMVLKERILVLVTIYLSFVYGVLYSREYLRTASILILTEPRSVVFEALPIVFVEKRGFSAEQLGLTYIGMFGAGARGILKPDAAPKLSLPALSWGVYFVFGFQGEWTSSRRNGRVSHLQRRDCPAV